MNPEKRMFLPPGKFFQHPICNIHYQLIDPLTSMESAPVLLMIHGLSGSMLDYLECGIIDSLRSKYRILLMDRPNCGHSEILSQPVDFDNQVSIAADLLDHLGIEKVHAVGHSLGGAFVLRLAQRFPEKLSEISLIAPFCYPIPLMHPVLKFFFQFYFLRWMIFFSMHQWVKRFPSQFVRNAFRPNASSITHTYQEKMTDMLRSFDRFFNELSILSSVADVLRQLKPWYDQLQVPLWIITGQNDLIVPSRFQSDVLVQKVVHAQRVEVPRCGHMVQFVATKQILDHLLENR